ncbi:hypothetical protein A7L51_19025 [Acinetobacter baumannii]|nr:hypothetical protein A7L51_19025 [Acinetobacter baumannii]
MLLLVDNELLSDTKTNLSENSGERTVEGDVEVSGFSFAVNGVAQSERVTLSRGVGVNNKSPGGVAALVGNAGDVAVGRALDIVGGEEEAHGGVAVDTDVVVVGDGDACGSGGADEESGGEGLHGGGGFGW